MEKFPVKIDLSTFFRDERKYVLLLVNPEWTSVKSLQQRVEHIFGLQYVGFLTNDDFFIPPQESIEVVKFTGTLKAFIPAKSLKRFNRKFVNASQISSESDSTILPVDESNKRKNVVLDEDYLSHRKRLKCIQEKVPENTIEIKKSDWNYNANIAPKENNSPYTERSLDKLSKKINLKGQLSGSSEPITLNAKSTDKNGKQKLSSLSHNSSHMYFDESNPTSRVIDQGNETVEQRKRQSVAVCFKCNLEETSETPSIILLKAIGLNQQTIKPKIQILENKLLPAATLNVSKQVEFFRRPKSVELKKQKIKATDSDVNNSVGISNETPLNESIALRDVLEGNLGNLSIKLTKDEAPMELKKDDKAKQICLQKRKKKI